jgi:hypothetical protein
MTPIHTPPPPFQPTADFIHTPQKRNIPRDQLLADLKNVAAKLSVQTLSQADYRKHSHFNPLTLTTRFGNWNAALKMAGLKPSRHFRVHPQSVLTDVRRVAKKLRTHHLLLTQYLTHGKFSPTLIYRHYQTWSNLLATAGLAPSTYHPRTTDHALLQNLESLWNHLGRQPTCLDLIPPHSRFGLTPYQRRFGGYQNALAAFVHWKQTNHLPAPEKRHHKTTRSINWRLRYEILKRDHFKCQSCGQSPATHPNVRLQVDHKTPWTKGGETLRENLQTLCDQCNIGKSNLPT